MAAISMTEMQSVRVTVGVDTHKDSHVARAKDQLGRGLGQITVPACLRGSAELLGWARSLGEIHTFGVEGTGCYGAGLSRYLRDEGCPVLEVIRSNRQLRRRNGKSDPADADAAASAVLSGDASGLPKAGDGTVEMIRVLRVARATAIRARTQAINALHALVITASEGFGNVCETPQLPGSCAAALPFVPVRSFTRPRRRSSRSDRSRSVTSP